MNRSAINTLALGLEVLRHGAAGLTDQQVGELLGLSKPAVRSRLKRLYQILGARNATHAVVIAAIDGLLSKDDLRVAYEDRRPREEGGAA